MNDYFDGIESLQYSDNSKDNILIVTSVGKINNLYDAINIIEAPNHQYILQYDFEEKKGQH